MQIYIGERQSGKTIMLIEMSEKTGATIVVATYQMAKYIRLLAAQMGKKIPVPITVTNYICLLASGGLGKSEKYLVDELNIDKLRARYPDGFDADHSLHRKANDI